MHRPRHGPRTASITGHGWHSQVHPGVQPRPPDRALLPAAKQSDTVCHMDLSQEKEHETRLWWDVARHSRPDVFRWKNGGPIPMGGVDAAYNGKGYFQFEHLDHLPLEVNVRRK